MRKIVLVRAAVAAVIPSILAVSSHAQGRGAAPDPVEKIVQLEPDLYYVGGGVAARTP